MSLFFSAAEIVQFAIRIEENGEAFYRAMAQKIKTPEIQGMFIKLADEEVAHRKIFSEMLPKVKDYALPAGDNDEFLSYLKAYADEHVFTDKKKASVAAEAINSARQALEFAIDIEMDSIVYYLEAKNLVPDDQKKIVDKVVEEERRHYMTLTALKKKF
jgi:rubrerythrin